MTKNKTYRRMVRRRVEAALRLRLRPGSPASIMDQPLDAIPPEVIDLHTGPFESRFPELARGDRKR
jgi:hypothetical protein